MPDYLQLGKVSIPVEDTFIADGEYIHLPMRTFRRITQEVKLEVMVEARDRDDGDFPFRFKAMLPDVAIPIGAIGNSENLFD